MARLATITTAAIVVVSCAASDSAAATWLVPPVDGPIGQRFVAPAGDYAPGHRGVDYVVAAGTAVRASAAGTVTFAGDVAGSRAVTIAHGGGLETTYTSLSDIYVHEGEVVGQGRWIGRSGDAHPGGPEGLHFGVKVDGRYEDPLEYLGPLDVADAVHLAPLLEEAERDVLAASILPRAATNVESCRAPEDPGPSPPPPNDNVAVAIAGINSATAGENVPEIYGEHDPRALGYASGNVYHFSYKGPAGPRFHEPYGHTDTYAPIEDAAKRLGALLEAVARRHPGSAVDLIAHSQGGLVARAFLERMAEAWDPRFPRVEHLVTLSTPHRGAPLAGQVPSLRDETETGRLLLGGARLWSEHGGPIPDPYAPSIADMAPGSGFMEWLASEDVTLGTRVLSIAIPNDLVVPADRALHPGEAGRVVPPSGVGGHDAVVASGAARALAYSWLRDGPESCRGGWDTWGPRIGTVVGAMERSATWLLRGIEAAGPGEIVAGARLAGGHAGAAARLVRSGIAALWP